MSTTTSLSSGARLLLSSLDHNQTALDRVLYRLGSGSRLLAAGDDPAGTGAAAKADSQQARLDAASVNIQNGISRLQSTSSYLTSLNSTLTRMNELATFARNEVQDPADVALYKSEFIQLQEHLRSVIGGSQAETGGVADITDPLGAYNGTPLFGADGGSLLAIGIHADETVQLPVINLRTGATLSLITQDAGGSFTFDFSDPDAVSVLNEAIGQVTAGLTAVGSVESRLDYAAGTLESTGTALESKLSRIRDVDVAASTTALARLQVLTQAHVSMLRRADDMNSKLLSLLAT
ncbi:flagellin/flagellar hook associated protein [Opitutaceae bacterium TAV1]|nr:flagellin/flagellar hook associated protein [Opitutaceae bacterium TAV1]